MVEEKERKGEGKGGETREWEQKGRKTGKAEVGERRRWKRTTNKMPGFTQMCVLCMCVSMCEGVHGQRSRVDILRQRSRVDILHHMY